jgi:hypothetical protein
VAGWNEITLATPHTFDTSKYTFIGYHVEGAAGSFPISLAAANNVKQSYYTSGATFSLTNMYNIASSGYAFLIRATVDTVTTPAYEEVQLSEVVIPHYLVAGNQQTVGATIKNTGSVNITSVDMQYTIGSDVSTVETITGLNIAPGNSATITYPTPYTFSAQYYPSVEVTVSDPNGVADDISDNTGDLATHVSTTATQRIVLHEVFTSSTCGPCKAGNEKLATVINQINDDTKWATIKYQVNWPSTGDPYFTMEGYERVKYYGINSAPDLVGDGGWKFWDNPYYYTLADFTTMYNLPAMATMTASAESKVSQKTVDFEVEITPTMNTNSSDFAFFAAIVEKKTTANVKTNGQTSFDYVMKKFLTSTAGDPIGAMTAGTTMAKKQYSYTFNGEYRLPEAAVNSNNTYIGIQHATEHSVEEFSDLMVVYWIQNTVTGDVLQAGKVDATPDGTPEPPRGIDTYLQGDVKINVYPNPATDNLYVGLESTEVVIEQLDIYNLQGQCVKTALNSSQISTSDIASGMYLLRIITNKGITTHKFIKQ